MKMLSMSNITKILLDCNLEVMQIGADLYLVGYHPYFNKKGSRRVTAADLKYIAAQLFKKARRHYE